MWSANAVAVGTSTFMADDDTWVVLSIPSARRAAPSLAVAPSTGTDGLDTLPVNGSSPLSPAALALTRITATSPLLLALVTLVSSFGALDSPSKTRANFPDALLPQSAGVLAPPQST